MSNGEMAKTPELARVLNYFVTIGIALAAIAPTVSIFMTFGDAYHMAGTGVAIGFALGGILTLCIAMCYAEVGASYPYTGGEYSLVTNVLGERYGVIIQVLFIFKGIVLPSVLALAGASYLHQLIPLVPTNIIALILVLVVIFLAMGGIKTSGWIASAMVALEVLVVAVFAISASNKIIQPANLLFHPVIWNGGALAPTPTSGIIACVVAALFAYDGFQVGLYFSEETRASGRRMGLTVMITAIIGILLELPTIAIAMLALPSLSGAANNATPLVGVIRVSLGLYGGSIVLLGIIISSLDATLAATMPYGRIFFAAARDGHFPASLNKFLTRLNKNKIPYGAFVILAIPSVIICLFSSLLSMVTFTGVLLMVFFFSAAVCAIFNRLQRKELPFKMILWPLPPVIAIAGIIVVLTQIEASKLYIVGAMIVVGILYSFYVINKKNTKQLEEEKII